MEQKEIVKYIDENKWMITKALAMMQGRIGIDDIEDARQELFITMIKCLHRYDSEKGSVKTYLWQSISKKALGLYEGYIVKSIGAPLSIDNLQLGDENGEITQEGIIDKKEDTTESKVLADTLLSGIDSDTREMITLWAEHYPLRYIAAQQKMSIEGARKKIMRTLRMLAREEV